MDDLIALRQTIKNRMDQADIAVQAFTAWPLADGDRQLAAAEATRNAFRAALEDIDRTIRARRPYVVGPIGTEIIDLAKARRSAQ